jgi:hypothetical protein
LNIKILGGAFVVVILLCVGIYFYAEWSNKRFASELGAPPQFTAASEPTSKTKSNKVPPVAETSSIEVREFVSEDTHKDTAVSEPEPVETSESMNEDIPGEAAETSESPSEFDATPLLSAFGLPEEVTTLFDEDVDPEDFEAAEAYLVEEYGQSPEVKAILDKLQQLSGGRVELDTLTGLFEAWIQVLPEEDRENRRQLMNVLTQLQQVQVLGGDGEVSIEVQVIDGGASGD